MESFELRITTLVKSSSSRNFGTKTIRFKSKSNKFKNKRKNCNLNDFKILLMITKANTCEFLKKNEIYKYGLKKETESYPV